MNWTSLILGKAAYVLKDYITGTICFKKNLSSLEALVVRDGHEHVLLTRDVVPGGESVAADARIIYVTSGLERVEALLTGESMPVQKRVAVLDDPELPSGDRTNMVYSSTIVPKGRGRAIVTAIIMGTDIGKVAAQLNEKSNQGHRTKLLKSLNRLYSSFLVLAAAFALIILATVKFQNIGYGIGMYSLTAALYVLPAGLTTIIAVMLVMGGKEMTQQKALVRRLKCLETLINHLTASSSGGPECYDKVDKTAAVSECMRDLIRCAALCNGSSIRQNTAVSHKEDLSNICEQDIPEDAVRCVATGAPTEVALQTVLFSKGAAESILPLCDNVQDPDSVMERVNQLASRGLRVIMLAKRTIDHTTVFAAPDDDIGHSDYIVENDEKRRKHYKREDVECHWEYLGIVGIYDPPRAESRDSVAAVAAAHRASTVVHMLTGDHHITTTAIVKETNTLTDKLLKTENMEQLVKTGPQFDAMTEEQVDALPSLPLVVARCSPETKVKMIQASQRRRLVSAMTGDGVNDSPSLRIADVGVAMGKTQASDVVLTDDNFATIIRAIAEGRRIYQIIQLFLKYYYIVLFGIGLLPLISLAVHDPSGRSVAPFSTLQMVYYFFDTFVYSAVFVLFFMVIYILLLGGFTVDRADCYLNYQPDLCNPHYRARATLFVFHSFVSVVVMTHCRSYREPEWNWKGIKATFTSRTVLGSLLVYTICSATFINESVIAINRFRFTRITWEWGLAFGFVVVYIFIGELYKCTQRKWIGRWLTRVHSPDALLLSS
ncbi:E1-E2 ATPase-domain-containing protein [Zychaea mexicana]|uniref:E1-E2 ATPase-domain-containing protein n=1 Tax=Zychaea mexicana TaxID=64656 RepID=UPI0022FF0D18|nr:E1-E2 ATPase-domain-containing protein [Zychaea mexicana]KAI9495382.1 E1-E2 ATPase-domain-containing protein [Zychaea mexicana]